MILLIITEIRLVIHAIDHQSIQKITDLHVSVLLAPAPDIIHLPAHLLKIIERVRVFGKYLVAIILDPRWARFTRPALAVRRIRCSMDLGESLNLLQSSFKVASFIWPGWLVRYSTTVIISLHPMSPMMPSL